MQLLNAQFIRTANLLDVAAFICNPALGRLRKGVEFEAILGCRARPFWGVGVVNLLLTLAIAAVNCFLKPRIQLFLCDNFPLHTVFMDVYIYLTWG